ncbi:MAG: TonB family protein [Bacteroidota bacterium]
MKRIPFFLFLLILSISVKAQQVKGDSITCIFYPERQPEFKGGMNGLRKFIEKNLKYPPNNICVTGKVYIQFVVEKDGRVTHPIILRSLAKAYDDEAIRLVRLMPKWIPAKDYEGKKFIKSKFTIPINFTLQ